MLSRIILISLFSLNCYALDTAADNLLKAKKACKANIENYIDTTASEGLCEVSIHTECYKNLFDLGYLHDKGYETWEDSFDHLRVKWCNAVKGDSCSLPKDGKKGKCKRK